MMSVFVKKCCFFIFIGLLMFGCQSQTSISKNNKPVIEVSTTRQTGNSNQAATKISDPHYITPSLQIVGSIEVDETENDYINVKREKVMVNGVLGLELSNSDVKLEKQAHGYKLHYRGQLKGTVARYYKPEFEKAGIVFAINDKGDLDILKYVSGTFDFQK